MKALRDAGLLVAIAVAALTVRVSPVETPAPLPSPSVAQDSLLRVDIEDFEAAEWAAGAQLPAAAVLEDLEVDLTATELEDLSSQALAVVQAMVLGAAQGPAVQLLSQLETAAPQPPCLRVGAPS